MRAASTYYVRATWPEGWHKVRTSETEWWFELRDADGVAMVTGAVIVRPSAQYSSAHMRLTDAARKLVRRRYQAMSAWQRNLLKAKADPWRARFPSMRKGKLFDSYERQHLPIVVARLRALGWEIGEELPTGVEILLTGQAAGWAEEREAGDRFWVMPSDGGPGLAYGVAAGDEYPWCQWDTQTTWGSSDDALAGASAIATEIDQVLRRGLPDGLMTWAVLGHEPAERPKREPAPRPVEAAEDEAPIRDSLTLWDQPLVNPRRVGWKHRRVLESHPNLPPPTGALPRWERRVPFLTGQYDRGLWEIARFFRDGYFLPRVLSEEHQKLLRRARAAARAIEDAPSGITDELLRRVRHSEPPSRNSFLLEERLLWLAYELEAAGADPDLDVSVDCLLLIGILEACAAESFDLALRQAETVEIAVTPELHLWNYRAAVPSEKLGVQSASRVERVVCDCGSAGRWLLIFIGEHGAIGCTCGRLRWADRLDREAIEKADPGKFARFYPPFDLDAIAGEFGYGPFRHNW
ncbi:hypothetical protein ACGF12_22880 [Kitasatospora sp. NPDC048296]|uniref:hypothetical protein n=1 Tax=Kitasatospora sp. NPDC048296 TaxID=3364048 RepID=UPI0037210A4E